MNWFQQLPIKRKLNLVVGLTCVAVLVPMCAALMAYQIYDFRRTLARDTTVLADVLARNSEADLAFQDQDGARKTLQAAEAEPAIAAACLYDAAGALFAQYARDGVKTNVPAQAPVIEQRFEPDWLMVSRAVTLNEKRIGTIYLQAGLQGLHHRLWWSVKLGLPVLIACILGALALSSRLQRPISEPILALAETARVVAERHDYTVRATSQQGHELGLLTAAFNQMLTEIQEQNRALKESEERFRLMVVSVRDYAIFGVDIDGRIATWNVGAERALGYQAQDVIGRHGLVFYTPEDTQRGQFETELTETRTEGRFRSEGWRVRKDGSRFWASVALTAVWDPAGALRGYVIVMRDVTERKEAEAALSYERDLLNTLMNNLPDSIYFKDLQSRFVRVSKSKLESTMAYCLARHRAGHPGEKALNPPEQLSSVEGFASYLQGKSDADFYNEEDARLLHLEETEIIRTGVPIISKVERTRLLDGQLAWFITTKMPWRDKDGNIIGTFGTSKDISGLKEIEQKLQTQLERVKLLDQTTRAIGERQDLRSIYQVVISRLEDHLPVDFACVCAYDALAKTLAVTGIGGRSEALADSMGLVEHTAIPIDQNGLAHCLRGQLVYEADTSLVSFPFPQRLAAAGLHSVVFAPLQVESQIFGILIVARRARKSFSSPDCEFLKQLSEHVALAAHQAQLYTALQRAFDELRQTQQTVMQQERLRALGQMASGIAHDINNAIAPVSLYTESLLESETNLSARARGYLQTIQRSIEDVAHTVARMREFYRQREPLLNFAPALLNELAEQVIDLSRARWSTIPQQRGAVIKMITELAADLPVVMAVESEIREALVNLIFNAVDAMPEGGTLTVRTKAVPGVENRRRIAVEISDTGVGMDEATRRRCLEPFFTTKGERGTGLGLAMVYGIVQRHGGDIEIESAPGKGTTFRLFLPVGATSTAKVSSIADIPVPARQRILIVDDDPLLIRSLRDILEGDGHVVVCANGGQEGIDLFRTACAGRETFALVVTDLGMPSVDGRQVASAVKAASASTPVILLTGWGERLLAEGDVPPHVDEVLSKPPKLRDLRQALARCLAGARKEPAHV
ncbi:MAG TPA: PAS domain S-box protein [Candidatus Cybelea sp.]|nr:PAS domain S-box protein [Candidatus Cybelea sp.]